VDFEGRECGWRQDTVVPALVAPKGHRDVAASLVGHIR